MAEPNQPESEKRDDFNEAVDNWLANRPASDVVRDMLTPIEGEVQKVLETTIETDQWEALGSVSKRFNELMVLLKKHYEDPTLNISDESLDNLNSLIGQLDTIASLIDAVKQEIDQSSDQLSPLVAKLLNYSVEALKERFSKMQQAVNNIKAAVDNDVPYGDEIIAFKQDKDAFQEFAGIGGSEIYTGVRFEDLVRALDRMTHDPNAKNEVLNFEADISEIILNTLRVPACIESSFAAYLTRREQEIEDLDVFNEMYESKFKADFKAEKESIEKELATKRQQAKDKVEMWGDRDDNPQYTELVYRNQAYWEQMTPEQLFEQRLRYRAFELLLPSAGEKQVASEVMSDLYQDWNSYRSQKKLKEFAQEKQKSPAPEKHIDKDVDQDIDDAFGDLLN